ncbi:hypothetical protein [Streptosporangium sandarakinum]|uniref:hypothetical protein n=1 Tax=Streptosporangium sandarakinum TaxID=1260955 RepID=UPI0037159214
MRKSRKLALVVGITTIIGVAGAAPAAADQWPFDGIPPDKSTHSYCYTSSVDSTLKSYIPGAMNYLADATTIPGVPLHATCDTKNSNEDGDPATDVAWFNIWIDDAYGEAPCRVRTASDSSICDQRFAKINGSMIKAGPDAHHQYIKTVCHELGHTAGLDHYSPLVSPPEPPGAFGQPQDCMASGEVTRIGNPAGSWTWTYNQHHISDANPWWA